MLSYYSKDVTFAEHPSHISLTYGIVGCPMNCKGCHSKELAKQKAIPLTPSQLMYDLQQYGTLIDNVCFLGGEWQTEDLIELLKVCDGYHTTLYSGQEAVSDELLNYLSYIKYGSYRPSLGGLDSPSTNQRMLDLKNNKDITYLFKKSL